VSPTSWDPPKEHRNCWDGSPKRKLFEDIERTLDAEVKFLCRVIFLVLYEPVVDPNEAAK
jgi:hypothetical protein